MRCNDWEKDKANVIAMITSKKERNTAISTCADLLSQMIGVPINKKKCIKIFT